MCDTEGRTCMLHGLVAMLCASSRSSCSSLSRRPPPFSRVMFRAFSRCVTCQKRQGSAVEKKTGGGHAVRMPWGGWQRAGKARLEQIKVSIYIFKNIFLNSGPWGAPRSSQISPQGPWGPWGRFFEIGFLKFKKFG